MLLAGFSAGPTGTNCYLLAPGPGEQCLVVDPGLGAVEQLDALLAEHRLYPVAVLLSHGHVDHTFSVVPVCEAKDVPAYLHPADRYQLTDPWSGLGLPRETPLFGHGPLTFAEPADLRELGDGEVLSLAGLELTARHAPGHTPGSVTFSLRTADRPLLLSGDLLFAGSIGRVDLPGGSEQAMLRSLVRVVLPLEDETVVHPGHGPSTTVGRERASNPYLHLAADAADRIR